VKLSTWVCSAIVGFPLALWIDDRARSGADKTRVDGYRIICTGGPGLDDGQRNA